MQLKRRLVVVPVPEPLTLLALGSQQLAMPWKDLRSCGTPCTVGTSGSRRIAPRWPRRSTISSSHREQNQAASFGGLVASAERSLRAFLLLLYRLGVLQELLLLLTRLGA